MASIGTAQPNAVSGPYSYLQNRFSFYSEIRMAARRRGTDLFCCGFSTAVDEFMFPGQKTTGRQSLQFTHSRTSKWYLFPLELGDECVVQTLVHEDTVLPGASSKDHRLQTRLCTLTVTRCWLRSNNQYGFLWNPFFLFFSLQNLFIASIIVQGIIPFNIPLNIII